MNEDWSRQKRELDSYNTFFSAIKGEVTGQGLHNLGYRLVGRFLHVPDSRNDVEPSPDFLLYNGETLLLVEVKSGENIATRDIEQMEDSNALSIEAAQNYLNNTEIRSRGLNPDELRHVQPCIVYYEDFIEEECKPYDGCVESLNELSGEAAVLTQDKGSDLRLESGEVADPSLEASLNDGIQLPQIPDKNVYLTEGVEKECLAFSICHDCVMNNMGKGRIRITAADVTEFYANREIPLHRVSSVLSFLDEVGACRRRDEGEYEFTAAHMSNIMEVEEQLRERNVDEWLGEEAPGQSSIHDF
jgi:hypothetical protein